MVQGRPNCEGVLFYFVRFDNLSSSSFSRLLPSLLLFVDVPDIIKEYRSYLPFEKVTGYCSYIFVLQVFVGDYGFI